MIKHDTQDRVQNAKYHDIQAVHQNKKKIFCRNESQLRLMLPSTTSFQGSKFHLSDRLRWVKMTVGPVE